MTRIQELKDRIILLRRHIVEEKDGSFKENWQQINYVWAKIVCFIGQESYGENWNNVAPPQTKYKVTMRYHRMKFARIKWDEIILALLCPPLIDETRQWMTCLMYKVGEEGE
ncbi:MAG: hypothetical protein FJX71_00475 [Alphaproteobacteria bacterium]|nr:hypothetical protein [Alphaproteobacteria bacterium]